MTREEFEAEMAKDCECCLECGGGGRPCAGVCAGGFCDRICFCPDDDDDAEDEDWS